MQRGAWRLHRLCKMLSGAVAVTKILWSSGVSKISSVARDIDRAYRHVCQLTTMEIMAVLRRRAAPNTQYYILSKVSILLY